VFVCFVWSVAALRDGGNEGRVVGAAVQQVVNLGLCKGNVRESKV
jgi:hypothetical protein